MIGHRTRFRENGDLPPWRGSAAKKKRPFFNTGALMTRKIMGCAMQYWGMTLNSFICFFFFFFFGGGGGGEKTHNIMKCGG